MVAAGPRSNMLSESTMAAFNECHSLKSKDNGLLELRHDIEDGRRAGEKAPTGYQLEKETVTLVAGQRRKWRYGTEDHRPPANH